MLMEGVVTYEFAAYATSFLLALLIIVIVF